MKLVTVDAWFAPRPLRRSRGSCGASFLLASILACGHHASVLAQDVPLSILEERAFQQAAAKAESAVVRIETVGGVDVIGESLVANGPTSGVVVGADGWIITSSFNFLSQPTSILVTVGEGQRYPAKLVAKDESRQLTLLKVEATGLKTLEPVSAGEFRVGQWTVALGRTLEPTFPNVSVGILSAVNRISGKALQTDAKTSPVNYGGALIDLEGRCLGVIVPMSPDREEVTAGVDWYDSGIGFAVPLVDVMRVVDRMKAGETLKPGRLGILYPDRGLLTGEVKIDKVRPRSPAEAAGLQVDDVIVGLDGKTVDRAATLKQLLGPKYGGDTVVLKVRRGEETLEKPVTLVSQIPPFEPGILGVLPARTAKSDKAAATIRGVLPGSAAEQGGLKAGMVVTKVRDKATASWTDVRTALENQSAGDKLTVEVEEAGQKSTREITLGGSAASVPEAIVPVDVPSPAAAPEKVKVGRFVDTIEGDERRFWAYVPEHYNPDFSYGLVVWLHPESDKREASTFRLWKPVCDQRGLILVAPPAGNEQWGQADVGYVLGVIARMQKRYAIDSERIVVVGEAEGGRLALFLALMKRDVISAAATIGLPLPAKAPEVDPQNPVRLHVSAFEGNPKASAVSKSVEAFQKEK
ncbi:MAG TPA: PDZ domain-containing protein, partial [Caulifigura sp.]|nr:PDZ domain-containing protein [Caulifigura sp.]